MDRAGAMSGADGPGQSVLFVDPTVEDAEILLSSVTEGIKVVRLKYGMDPLVQIAECLAGQRNIAALHILSHGAPGALFLVGDRIDLPGLAVRRGVLAQIAATLSEQAQVVLYGCSVAAGAPGSAFVGYLQALLGARVSAANLPVGSAARGGGWALSGRDHVASEPCFSSAARAAYSGLLDITGKPFDDTLTGTADDDSIRGLAGNDLLVGGRARTGSSAAMVTIPSREARAPSASCCPSRATTFEAMP